MLLNSLGSIFSLLFKSSSSELYKALLLSGFFLFDFFDCFPLILLLSLVEFTLPFTFLLPFLISLT